MKPTHPSTASARKVPKGLYCFLWRGVMQINADGTPMLFTSLAKAKARNNSQCKIVPVALQLEHP